MARLRLGQHAVLEEEPHVLPDVHVVLAPQGAPAFSAFEDEGGLALHGELAPEVDTGFFPDFACSLRTW